MANKITIGEMADGLHKASRGQFLRELHNIALFYAAQAQTRASTRAETVLTVRSGRLAGSILGRVEKAPGLIAVRLSAGGGGDDVKNAAIHEYGDTIYPKKGKYLRFPWGPGATTAVGVSRGSGGSRWASKESVTIPPRPYLKPSIDEVEEKMIPEVRRLIRGVLV